MADEIILIVEDNDILRDGLRDMLTYEGFTIITARHGLEALEKMQDVRPDLILSDVMMPVVDGFGLFNEVRSHPEWVTIPFIFLTARAEPSYVLIGRNLGAEDYLVKPVSREELVTSIRSRLVRSHQVQMAQLQAAYQASLTALANAIDIRDSLSHGHVERVTAYAVLLAEELHWNHQNLENLKFGAILHDIGKIHISETILLKSTPLDEDEWEEIRRHPIIGSEMVKGVPYLAKVAPIVRHHHERWDGKGYPDQLVREATPLGARILCVADAFDAMTNPRPYAEALEIDQAYQEISSLAGYQFDPLVVKAFQEVWKAGQIVSIAATRGI